VLNDVTGAAVIEPWRLTAAMLSKAFRNVGELNAATRRTVNPGEFGDEFQSVLAQVRKGDFSTRRNGAVFWSGYREGNHARAMAWARANRKQTIEMTEGGKWLERLDLYGPNSRLTSREADHIWRAASARFSRGAFGKVNAFTRGTQPDTSKVFYGLELPLLKSNANVSRSITYRGY